MTVIPSSVVTHFDTTLAEAKSRLLGLPLRDVRWVDGVLRIEFDQSYTLDVAAYEPGNSGNKIEPAVVLTRLVPRREQVNLERDDEGNR